MLSVITLFWLSINSVSAQDVGLGATDVVGGDLSNVASGGFGDIAALVADNMIPFMNIIAGLVIIVAGLLAVVAQDENRIQTARKVTSMALIGIVLINLSLVLRDAYLTGLDFDGGANPTAGADIVSQEIYGFILFGETIAAVIAIITMIVYGIKAVVDYNGEQGLQSFKKAVLSILFGVLVIAAKFLFADAVARTGDPHDIVYPAIITVYNILGYGALAAVVVIIIAGIVMILNIGDEERFRKARLVLLSVATGFIFIAVMFGLINILLNAF